MHLMQKINLFFIWTSHHEGILEPGIRLKWIISLPFRLLYCQERVPDSRWKEACVGSRASLLVRTHGLVQDWSQLSSFLNISADNVEIVIQLSVSPHFIKIPFLWGVSPCSLIGIYHCVGGICCLHFQILCPEDRGNRLSEMFVTFNQTTQCYIR